MSSASLNRGAGLILHQGTGSGLYSNRLTVSLLLFAGSIFFPARAQLSRNNLFPFGTGAGDTQIFRNDDDVSLAICPDVPYIFYDRNSSCYWVSFKIFLLLSNSIFLEQLREAEV